VDEAGVRDVVQDEWQGNVRSLRITAVRARWSIVRVALWLGGLAVTDAQPERCRHVAIAHGVLGYGREADPTFSPVREIRPNLPGDAGASEVVPVALFRSDGVNDGNVPSGLVSDHPHHVGIIIAALGPLRELANAIVLRDRGSRRAIELRRTR
jgi:hypothetical protein